MVLLTRKGSQTDKLHIAWVWIPSARGHMAGSLVLDSIKFLPFDPDQLDGVFNYAQLRKVNHMANTVAVKAMCCFLCNKFIRNFQYICIPWERNILNFSLTLVTSITYMIFLQTV